MLISSHTIHSISLRIFFFVYGAELNVRLKFNLSILMRMYKSINSLPLECLRSFCIGLTHKHTHHCSLQVSVNGLFLLLFCFSSRVWQIENLKCKYGLTINGVLFSIVYFFPLSLVHQTNEMRERTIRKFQEDKKNPHKIQWDFNFKRTLEILE